MSLSFTVNLASKGFGQPLSLSIASEGVTAIFGPSGCGKTSLLRALSGLDRHPGTQVSFNHHVWQSESQFVPTYQRGLAYVFQEPSLFEHLSVQQNLDFAIKRRFNNKNCEFDVTRSVSLLNIEHLLQRSCNELSGGERQRVAIARALCTQPQLLLMDEPLSALDSEHKADIIPLLEGVCRVAGMPIIYVSHSLDEVARLADSLVLMQAGAVLTHGATAEVLASLDSPLAEHANAAAIVNGVVAKQEPDFALTHIDTLAGELCITHAEHLAIDEPVRLKLCARDVSIALKRPQNTSILNTLNAQITEIRQQNDSQILVRLNANGAPLLAKITRKSLHLLSLSVGQHVILQIKSVALL